jgi:hypothetical protein
MRQGTRFVVAVAMTVVAAAAIVVPAAAAGAAETPAGVAIAKVAPGSKTDPDNSFYAFTAEPGSTTTQQLLVGNGSSAAFEAHVDAVDGLTRSDTGVGYTRTGGKPVAAGNWIVVATPVLTLAPQEQQAVDFSVHVPDEAQPGVYLAGLSVYVPRQDVSTSRPTAPNAASVNVTLQPRRIVAVEVTVPGPKAPKLVITGARATAMSSGVGIALSMKNQGNDYAKGSGSIEVKDTGLRKQFKVINFLPRTNIDYVVPWTKDVLPGNHDVSVVLRYGDGQRLNWNGTVEINGALARSLHKSVVDRGSSSASSFPVMLLVAAGAFALLCVGGALFLRRRRNARPQLRPVLE